MNQKRINLCFDLDNAQQRAAFNFLQASGREKTATIVKLVLHEMLPSSNNVSPLGTPDNESQLINRLEKIIKDNNSQINISEIQRGIIQIISQLENLQIGATFSNTNQCEKKADSYNSSMINSETEMNEDAFSVMMAFYNP